MRVRHAAPRAVARPPATPTPADATSERVECPAIGSAGATPTLASCASPRSRPRSTAGSPLVALVAVCAIVVTGAAVRLTDSGLGCVDWPNCTQNHFVAKASFHPQVEQLNRDFTGLISVAVAVAVLGALALVPRRRDLIWWSLGLVAGLVGRDRARRHRRCCRTCGRRS